MSEDNSILMMVVLGTTVVLLLLGITFVLLYINNKKRFRYQQQLQAIQAQYKQTLLQSQLEIQEQTLQHISRELHDNLGRVASLIKINLNTLQLSDTAKATEKVELTKDLTRRLITDIKAMSVGLGSDHLNRTGLTKALQLEMDRLNKTGVVHADFIQHNGELNVDNEKAIILYRMVQEVLNNAMKHADAKYLTLTSGIQGNNYILAIKDDGKGFEKEKLTNNTSAGMQNLENRARLINATVKVDSAPGKGTTVTIELLN